MINVYVMYGLGGRLFSAGMEDVLAATIRATVSDVNCPRTRSWSEWESIVNEIKTQPKTDKTVVIGHSLGAATATYVTDYVPVDLLVLYDLAGKAPSKLGKNTKHCMDIHDTVFDLVPEWRVQPVKGYESRIERIQSRFGHTGVDDSLQIAKMVIEKIQKLATKEK